jgi:SpoIIAA-like
MVSRRVNQTISGRRSSRPDDDPGHARAEYVQGAAFREPATGRRTMLSVIAGLPEGVVGLEAVGRVEAADYEAVGQPAVRRAIEQHGKIRLLHVLDERFAGYTAGGATQDAALGLGHLHSFERIAVVTDSASIRRLVKLAGWTLPGELRLFFNSERDDADAWVSEGLSAR